MQGQSTDLRALIGALPNPVILIGSTERIAILNSPAEALMGTDCEGWHYITALRQPALLDAVEITLKEGGQRGARYLSNDGARDATWDVAVAGIQIDGQDAVLLSFSDITAVEEAGQRRRDFVANVSHELRTPLTSLLGFIETLQGPARQDPAVQERFLTIMAQEAGRMHRLVEDLLSLGRVEDLERIRPKDPVDLHQLVAEALETLKPLAESAGLHLCTDLPPEPTIVPGDRGQLWQVIRNLVENAIKYGGEGQGAGCDIVLSLAGPGYETNLLAEGVRLIVRDHGAGIEAHHIARLTERFYRIDSHRSREVGGTGLGLAIVKHIINRHRGRLRIESQPGEGAVFTVILPAQ